jgi:hypothetical protein
LVAALLLAGVPPSSSSSSGRVGSKIALGPSYTPEVEAMLLPLFLQYAQQYYK